MNELTKDADKMLCIIYKQYLNKVEDGNSKTASREFKEDFYTSDRTLSHWQEDDIATFLIELGKKGYLKIYFGGNFFLTDKAIIYMENRFKKGLSEVVDFITKFI